MPHEEVESSSGVGSLFSNGALLGRVPYALSIAYETADVRDIEGGEKHSIRIRSANGRLIMQNDLLLLDSNALLLKDLLLVLSDGRRARILIQSASMRTGNCHFAVRGDIEG